jgi:hypothetical protein
MTKKISKSKVRSALKAVRRLRGASPRTTLPTIARTYQARVSGPLATALPGAFGVRLERGVLYVGGERITAPRFGRDFVTFAQKSPRGFLAGVLNFGPMAMSFAGTLYIGPTAATAVEHGVCGAVAPTLFQTRVCKVGAVPPANTSYPDWSPPQGAPSDWSPSFDFKFGYEYGDEGTLPTPIYQLLDPTKSSDPLDLEYYCASRLADDESFILTMKMDDAAAAEAAASFGADVPVGFSIQFSLEGASFTGTIQRYDAGTKTASQTAYAWQGVGTASAHADAAMAVHTDGAALTAADGLSVAELISLQPDPKELLEQQFGLLLENMKYAISLDPQKSGWLSDFFAQRPPQGLSDARITAIKADAAFYTDRFAVSYFGHSFDQMTGPGAPDTHMSASQSLSLEYYMRAGLAYEPAYNRATQSLFLDAFTASTPRLNAYIDDKSADWAQELFDALTTPYQMNLAVQQVVNGLGTGLVNRHSTLLQALQPSGELAALYHKMITMASLSLPIDNLELDDKDKVAVWLGDAIAAFLGAYRDGTLAQSIKDADPAVQAALQAQAAELAAAVAKIGGVAQLAGALADLTVAAAGDNFWSRLSNAQGNWSKAGYRFAQSIYFLAIVGGLASSIIAFRQWDKLDDEKRASACISVIDIAVRIVKNIPEIFQTVGDIGSAVVSKIRACSVSGDATAAGVQMVELRDGPEAFPDGAQNMAEMANADAHAMEVEGTGWARVFKSTVGRVCEVIGVLAAVAFAIVSIIEFAKNPDGPDAALDGITMAANCGVAIFAVAGLFLETSWIPVLGAICALVSIVVTLVELFKPSSPPPNPSEVFMSTYLVPAAFTGSTAFIKPSPADWPSVDSPLPSDNPYATKPPTAMAMKLAFA